MNITRDFRVELNYTRHGKMKSTGDATDMFYGVKESYLESHWGAGTTISPEIRDIPVQKYNIAARDIFLIQGFYNWTSHSFFGWDLMHSFIGLGGGGGAIEDYEFWAPGHEFRSQSDKKTVPAVAASIGFSYDLSRWVSIDTTLRYIYMRFRTSKETSYRGMSAVDLMAGLRINLW
ncbi:MAG: hypothetical protein PHX68_04065 [Alphaproteobacteria bacterium]|nr:hypothetical protein [Alphaproteobacteria bacterium]